MKSTVGANPHCYRKSAL